MFGRHWTNWWKTLSSILSPTSTKHRPCEVQNHLLVGVSEAIIVRCFSVMPDIELKAKVDNEKAWLWTTYADFADGECKTEHLAIRFGSAESMHNSVVSPVWTLWLWFVRATLRSADFLSQVTEFFTVALLQFSALARFTLRIKVHFLAGGNNLFFDDDSKTRRISSDALSPIRVGGRTFELVWSPHCHWTGTG